MDFSILLASGMIVARRSGMPGQNRSDDTPYTGDFFWVGRNCSNVLIRLAGTLVTGALLLGVFVVL